MSEKVNKDKFSWKAEDTQVSFSQCSTCKHNTGGQKCEIYGRKPAQYADNDEDCPEYKKD